MTNNAKGWIWRIAGAVLSTCLWLPFVLGTAWVLEQWQGASGFFKWVPAFFFASALSVAVLVGCSIYGTSIQRRP